MKMRNENIGDILIYGYLIIIISAIVGWIMNIIELLNLEPFIISGKTVIGIIGIFIPPIGSIMGLFVW